MKFLYPEINNIFDTDISSINTLVIENQALLYDFIFDIYNQLHGKDGRCVLSQDNKELPISKNLELLTNFVPFELSNKNLVSKVCSVIEKNLLDYNYEKTQTLLSNIEELFLNATFDMPGDIVFAKININSIVKSLGIQFEENYDSLAEKIIDYMELVTEYDKQKLFVCLNLRSFIVDNEMEKFIDTALRHKFNILLIENREYRILSAEKRYIVDKELCEIS